MQGFNFRNDASSAILDDEIFLNQMFETIL